MPSAVIRQISISLSLRTENPDDARLVPTGGDCLLNTVNRELRTGDRLGRMGQTSRSADARNWMLVAPHLHFEVRDAAGKAYDPVEFLHRFGGT